MKLFYGFSVYFWIILIVLVVFGNYIFKTIYAKTYRVITGNDIDSKFYTTSKYGQHDYAYDLGKSIFRV